MPETEEEKKAREAREAADKAKADAEALARTGSGNGGNTTPGGGAGGDGGGSQPFATFPDADSFNKRIEREARKILKDAGLSETDPVKLKAAMDELAKVQAAQAEAERAKMSEIDRLKADLAKSEAEKAQAMSAAEEARMRAHVLGVCATKGITNTDYAMWAIANKLGAMGENEELDENAFLDELMKDEKQKIALGFAAPAQVQQQGATNTDTGKGPGGAPPAGGGGSNGGGGAPDATTMTKDQFNADMQRRFGWTPGS